MEQNKKVIKFLLSGGMAALAEYSTFIVLSIFEISLLLANTVSFFVGLCISFLLNKKWVFGVLGKTKERFARYSILALINLSLSSILLYFAAFGLNADAAIAKAVIMVLIAIWNYAIFSKIIFKD